MIRGQVRPSQDYSTGLEARISVEIVAANQIFQTLESVVDTGFEGAFTLPEWVARNWVYTAQEPGPLPLPVVRLSKRTLVSRACSGTGCPWTRERT